MSTCCTSTTCASGLAPATVTEPFPFDLGSYKKIALDPFKTGGPSAEEEAALKFNIALCRDAMVFFTAVADARGMGGHTGGPYDVVPEAVIMDAFFRGAPDKFVPIMYDEAGHRVALQYLFSVLGGHMPAEKLFHYREAHSHLPGHPEKDYTPGVKFSSGRLGHMWSFVNGVAMANPTKTVFMLGSDGSQQEGDDAEAARLAVARNLSVKLLIDDNDVTIAGFPSEYFFGYDVARTLIGHGLSVNVNDGENLRSLVTRMRAAVQQNGPVALINKRKMCPGIKGLEGSNHGHDVIKTATAIAYLEERGHMAAAEFLKGVKKSASGPLSTRGSDAAKQCNNRDDFGKIVAGIVSAMPAAERKEKVLVIDSDLEGSCGLHHIRKAAPEIYVAGGIMERGNFSSCAGFGYEPGRQGIFGTFSAFLEMCVSEITMARLNGSNVLAHFSHAGCDDMADNTCHFGINNMYADNGLPEGGKDTTRLYFPADALQLEKCVKTIFTQPGLRFVFSTRSKVPTILGENGQPFFGEGYTFSTKDDVIRTAGEGEGYIVAFGDTLYRAADAVEQLKEGGRKVGLINKATLNVYDEATMAKLAKAPWVLVVEGFNVKTGVGSRFGTELLKHGFKGKYNNIGTHHEGCGGLWEQMVHQGLDNNGIVKAVKAL